MLALETGWTPATLASLPAWFRAACHWALFIRTILPDGIPAVRTGGNLTAQQRQDAARTRVAIAKLRPLIYPEDET